MYDIFYVSKTNGNDQDWEKIKVKYPFAQRFSNIKTYDQIKSKALTKMFWVIWDDIELSESFDLNSYRATKWDDMYVHVFKNGEYYDGLCLFPRYAKISQREFNNRFFIDKKEVDIVASHPKPFDIFYINNYEEYQQSLEKTSTEMFWAVWPDITVSKDFKFDYYIPVYDFYHRNTTHIFKNKDDFDGLCLFSKNNLVSKREFYHRFFSEKKEVDIIASVPKQYNLYRPDTYEEYQKIKDDMFWLLWPETEIINDSVLDLYFSHHNIYDRRENHIFKNACNDSISFISGLVLCSKFKPISKREFDEKYVIDKKEHDIVATRYRYPRYILNSYEEYLEILKNENQKMFWGIWPEIEITDETIFDFYFDPKDWKTEFNIAENNTFKHEFNDKIISHNGPILFSKDSSVGKREFNYRLLTNKKENDRIISRHRPYDVFFISYQEPNADENYEKLLEKCPRAKRVHGVKGIHQAHIKAASMSDTDMIWVVDGDAVVVDDFKFDLVYFTYGYDIDCVHVWSSRNPINDLEYGYGGVKLLPRSLTLNMDVNTPDMTTSISKKFKAMKSVSNINMFNVDEFSTWRSAFRECCKLASRVIERQDDDETISRLQTWCSIGKDRPYGQYAILGANSGRSYGEQNKNNPEALSKINDFSWLKDQFDAR